MSTKISPRRGPTAAASSAGTIMLYGMLLLLLFSGAASLSLPMHTRELSSFSSSSHYMISSPFLRGPMDRRIGTAMSSSSSSSSSSFLPSRSYRNHNHHLSSSSSGTTTTFSMHMGHSHSHRHHHHNDQPQKLIKGGGSGGGGWGSKLVLFFGRRTVRILFAALITLLPPILKHQSVLKQHHHSASLIGGGGGSILTKTDVGAFVLTSSILAISDSIRDEIKALISKGNGWRLSWLKHSTPLSADYFFKNENAADRVTFLGIIINILLSSGKFVAGVSCHSSALIADAGHSLSDLFSDFLTLWAVQVARLPPDDDHPYGHGKFESVGSLFL